MEIFLDYARRLDLRDRDGQPLVKWSTPEECFDAWRECTRGRPVDYTGVSYEKLRSGSGIQWPCNEAAPDGTERLDAELVFPTLPEVCEDYGHDVQTAKAARDEKLLGVATMCQSEAEVQAKWLTTRIKAAAPQALVVG